MADKTIPASLNIGSTAHEVVNLARDTGDQVRQVADTLIGTAAKFGPLVARVKQRDYAASAGQWSQPLEKTVPRPPPASRAARPRAAAPTSIRPSIPSHFEEPPLGGLARRHPQEARRAPRPPALRPHDPGPPGLEHCGGATGLRAAPSSRLTTTAAPWSATSCSPLASTAWDDEDRRAALTPAHPVAPRRPADQGRPALDFVLRTSRKPTSCPTCTSRRTT